LVSDGVACGSCTKVFNVSGTFKTLGVTEANMGEVGLDDDRSNSRRDRNGG
jgi:hypothetical protein